MAVLEELGQPDDYDVPPIVGTTSSIEMSVLGYLAGQERVERANVERARAIRHNQRQGYSDLKNETLSKKSHSVVGVA